MRRANNNKQTFRILEQYSKGVHFFGPAEFESFILLERREKRHYNGGEQAQLTPIITMETDAFDVFHYNDSYKDGWVDMVLQRWKEMNARKGEMDGGEVVWHALADKDHRNVPSFADAHRPALLRPVVPLCSPRRTHLPLPASKRRFRKA